MLLTPKLGLTQIIFRKGQGSNLNLETQINFTNRLPGFSSSIFEVRMKYLSAHTQFSPQIPKVCKQRTKTLLKLFFLKNLLASELSLSENKGSNFLRTSLKVVPKHTTYIGDKIFLVIFDLPTLFHCVSTYDVPFFKTFSDPNSSFANVLMEVMVGIIIFWSPYLKTDDTRLLIIHPTSFHEK